MFNTQATEPLYNTVSEKIDFYRHNNGHFYLPKKEKWTISIFFLQ
jgi:hypothetical protein